MVKNVCPLPGEGQNHPLPLLLPHHLQLEDDFHDGGLHLVALALLGEVAKVLPVARPARHNLLVSIHAVVGLILFVTTLADKHMATV